MRRYNCSVSSFLRRITIPILLLHPISTGMRTVVALRPSSSFLPKQPLRHDISEQNHHAPRSSMRTATGEVFLHRRQSVQQPTSSSVSVSVSLLSSSSNQGSSTGGVESLSLDILGENHELVGDEIATSVQAMLDTEWMPQTIHSKMGQSVKQSYIKVRQNRSSSSNDDDDDDLIMTIMTTVADDLIANWKDYDKDAFVNAWDIANYVSDFLTTKVNGDGCGCSAKIY